MDPIWATAAELWWLAPSAVGAGAAGFVAIRRRRTMTGRRLGYDAARLELRQARQEARAAADAARIVRAETAGVVADRAAARTDGAAVASARRRLREAQRASKASAARVKAARARVSAERAAIRRGAHPLDAVRARHDRVLARWMDYETDAAKALAFPAMSDARQPFTAAFLAAVEQAGVLRPSAQERRMTASDFSRYRRAVDDLEQAFDIAERSARGEKVHQELPDALLEAARAIMEKAADAIDRTSELFHSWASNRRDPR
ncbi:hypothetical protein [Microbacterium soli]|uniref:Uncharacterized protein n=1 Tax=Microbacterium soli TaxID=446075 RepID=A0ABP7MTJ7_9MICO